MTVKHAFILWAAAAAVFAVSCKDGGKEPGPHMPEPETFVMADAFAEPGTEAGTLTLTMSSATVRDMLVSLTLSAEGAGVDENGVHIPAGEYLMPGGASDRAVLSGSLVRPWSDGPDGLVSASVAVTETEGGCEIGGLLETSSGFRFIVSFRGPVKYDRPEEPETVEAVMTSASVRYDNRLTPDGMNVHVLSLSDGNGMEACVELVSGAGTYFRNIPAGEWTVSSGAAEGVALKGENTGFTVGGTAYAAESGLASISGGPDGYAVSGSLTAADGSGMNFSYEGSLSVDRASVSLHGLSELAVDGQNYGFTYNDYTLTVTPQGEGTADVKYRMYITGPLDVYYRYLPIAMGTYTVYEGSFPLPVRAVAVNSDFVDAGFTFYDEAGAETFYRIAGGGMEITESEMGAGDIYTLGFSGAFTAVNDDDGNDTVEFDVSYRDELPYWDGYYYSWTAHPFSTLTEDAEFDGFTSAVYADKGYGRWYEEGGPEDVAYVQITFMRDGGIYEEWRDTDNADPDNYYMTIGLHLEKTFADAGGIPAGTYKMDKDWKFTPGTFMPGSILIVSNRPYGTNLLNGTMEYYAPFGCGPDEDGGEITIERSGDIYTFTVRGYDDNWPDAHGITASYRGRLTDESQVTSAAADVPAPVRKGGPRSAGKS